MIFEAVGTQTAAAKTALSVQATSAVKPRILAFHLSNIGTVSTDSGFEIKVQRTTTAGTGTSVTVPGTDPGDPAATALVFSNFSAEPSVTSNTLLKDISVNPRTTFPWVAYDQRAELQIPATANNGISWLVNALGGATTIVVSATVLQ